MAPQRHKPCLLVVVSSFLLPASFAALPSTSQPLPLKVACSEKLRNGSSFLPPSSCSLLEVTVGASPLSLKGNQTFFFQSSPSLLPTIFGRVLVRGKQRTNIDLTLMRTQVCSNTRPNFFFDAPPAPNCLQGGQDFICTADIDRCSYTPSTSFYVNTWAASNDPYELSVEETAVNVTNLPAGTMSSQVSAANSSQYFLIPFSDSIIEVEIAVASGGVTYGLRADIIGSLTCSNEVTGTVLAGSRSLFNLVPGCHNSPNYYLIVNSFSASTYSVSSRLLPVNNTVGDLSFSAVAATFGILNVPINPTSLNVFRYTPPSNNYGAFNVAIKVNDAAAKGVPFRISFFRGSPSEVPIPYYAPTKTSCSFSNSVTFTDSNPFSSVITQYCGLPTPPVTISIIQDRESNQTLPSIVSFSFSITGSEGDTDGAFKPIGLGEKQVLEPVKVNGFNFPAVGFFKIPTPFRVNKVLRTKIEHIGGNALDTVSVSNYILPCGDALTFTLNDASFPVPSSNEYRMGVSDAPICESSGNYHYSTATIALGKSANVTYTVEDVITLVPNVSISFVMSTGNLSYFALPPLRRNEYTYRVVISGPGSPAITAKLFYQSATTECSKNQVCFGARVCSFSIPCDGPAGVLVYSQSNTQIDSVQITLNATAIPLLTGNFSFKAPTTVGYYRVAASPSVGGRISFVVPNGLNEFSYATNDCDFFGQIGCLSSSTECFILLPPSTTDYVIKVNTVLNVGATITGSIKFGANQVCTSLSAADVSALSFCKNYITPGFYWLSTNAVAVDMDAEGIFTTRYMSTLAASTCNTSVMSAICRNSFRTCNQDGSRADYCLSTCLASRKSCPSDTCLDRLCENANLCELLPPPFPPSPLPPPQAPEAPTPSASTTTALPPLSISPSSSTSTTTSGPIPTSALTSTTSAPSPSSATTTSPVTSATPPTPRPDGSSPQISNSPQEMIPSSVATTGQITPTSTATPNPPSTAAPIQPGDASRTSLTVFALSVSLVILAVC